MLNAKDYGIPQNRERVYTISIRKDIDNRLFKFPEKQELKLKLKDMLEDEVDEKYYLSDKMINYICANNEKWTGNNKESLINKTIASTINTGEGSKRCDASNYIGDGLSENLDLKNKKQQCYLVKENIEQFEHEEMLEDDIETLENEISYRNGTKDSNLRIRKLTPKECWRLMGFKDEEFEKAQKVNSNAQLYKQAGNSIVVDVLEKIFRNLLEGE